jgi:hypothetical protein
MADITNSVSISENNLFQLIKQSKQQVSIQSYRILTLLFWQFGFSINENILNET